MRRRSPSPALSRSRPFSSRSPSRSAAGRCCGWRPWRRSPCWSPGERPGTLALALAGYAAFTVLLWGTLYYRLRTGAPWTNFLRFWRLVLSNSDPTSGNALEQVPKFLMALSAGTLLAEEPSAFPQIAAAAALTRHWERWPGAGSATGSPSTPLCQLPTAPLPTRAAAFT